MIETLLWQFQERFNAEKIRRLQSTALCLAYYSDLDITR